jgi:hypothetical protein
MPSIVKLKHHHDHGEPAAITEHPSQEYHDNCVICNFEFSVFLSVEGKVYFEEEDHPKYYLNDYASVHFQNLSQFNFLLRAPPSFQI